MLQKVQVIINLNVHNILLWLSIDRNKYQVLLLDVGVFFPSTFE